MTFEDLQGLAAPRIPDAHGVVPGPRRDPLAHPVPGHAVYEMLVTFEDLHGFAAARIPDAHGVVGGPGRDPLPVPSQATLFTDLSWPSRTCTALPLPASQMRTVLSPDPDATRWPVLSQATLFTESGDLRGPAGLCRYPASQIRTVLSSDPDATRWPVPSQATLSTMSRVTFEDLHGFAAARIPDAHGAVPGPGRDPLARPVPGHAVYPILVTFEDLQGFAAPRIPDTHGVVGGPGRDPLARPAPGHAVDDVRVTFEDLYGLPPPASQMRTVLSQDPDATRCSVPSQATLLTEFS